MGNAAFDWRRPNVLRTVAEHRGAVAEVDRLLDRDPRKGSVECDRLQLICVLIASDEEAPVPGVDAASPKAIVDYRLQQKGLERADVADYFGGSSRVSEFFAGKRRFRRARSAPCAPLLGIPADLLLR